MNLFPISNLIILNILHSNYLEFTDYNFQQRGQLQQKIKLKKKHLNKYW